MRVVVIGAGMAGLTAARRIADGGHEVTVVDKGRVPGGRLATRQLIGGARADHGAQFFTVRSDAFAAAVDRWLADGTVHEWCRGFNSDDGHPRYAVARGMASLPLRMAVGLDVRQSVNVASVEPSGGRWVVTWPAAHGAPGGALTADVVVLTAPVPQAADLVAGHATIPSVSYEPTLSLLIALADPPSIPWPGAIQLHDDPTWSWIGDNVAKGASQVPAVTLHTRADVAAVRWGDDPATLTADLVRAASPWLGGSAITDTMLHRWRYATPVAPHSERCVATSDGRMVFAGDAFGGPRVEGAYLSGLAAADAVLGESP